MKKHYSHIRREKRRQAVVAALEIKLPPQQIEFPVETQEIHSFPTEQEKFALDKPPLQHKNHAP